MDWQRCLAVAINIPEDLPASSSGLRTKISVNLLSSPSIFICSLIGHSSVSVFSWTFYRVHWLFFNNLSTPVERLINYESWLHRKNDIYSLEHAGILFNFPITQRCLLLLNTWQLGILAHRCHFKLMPLFSVFIICRFLTAITYLINRKFCKTD